jgi:hypothetical protein
MRKSVSNPEHRERGNLQLPLLMPTQPGILADHRMGKQQTSHKDLWTQTTNQWIWTDIQMVTFSCCFLQQPVAIVVEYRLSSSLL